MPRVRKGFSVVVPHPRGESFPGAAVAAHLQQLEILFASKIGMKDLPNLSECQKLRMVGLGAVVCLPGQEILGMVR